MEDEEEEEEEEKEEEQACDEKKRRRRRFSGLVMATWRFNIINLIASNNYDSFEITLMSQLMRLRYLSHRRPTSESSGEPAHPRSLARAFAVRTHKIWK